MKPHFLPLLCTGLIVASTGSRAQDAGAKPGPELFGAWRHVERDTVLRLEPERWSKLSKGRPVSWLARYEPGRAVLNLMGRHVELALQLDDGRLRITEKGTRETNTYERIEEVPEGFEIQPMELGRPRRLPRRFTKRIAKELKQRLRKDQQARTGRIDDGKMAKVDADNTAYLKDLVAKAGWIDVKRFGPEAADAAATLALHSNDLPLMLAALPGIRKELEARDDDRGRRRGAGGPMPGPGSSPAQSYATLHDSVRLLTGRRQRYGTQIVTDERGRSVVYPLEDAEKVDVWRREIGLPTLEESLAMQKRWTGSDIPVQEF